MFSCGRRPLTYRLRVVPFFDPSPRRPFVRRGTGCPVRLVLGNAEKPLGLHGTARGRVEARGVLASAALGALLVALASPAPAPSRPRPTRSTSTRSRCPSSLPVIGRPAAKPVCTAIRRAVAPGRAAAMKNDRTFGGLRKQIFDYVVKDSEEARDLHLMQMDRTVDAMVKNVDALEDAIKSPALDIPADAKPEDAKTLRDLRASLQRHAGRREDAARRDERVRRDRAHSAVSASSARPSRTCRRAIVPNVAIGEHGSMPHAGTGLRTVPARHAGHVQPAAPDRQRPAATRTCSTAISGDISRPSRTDTRTTASKVIIAGGEQLQVASSAPPARRIRCRPEGPDPVGVPRKPIEPPTPEASAFLETAMDSVREGDVQFRLPADRERGGRSRPHAGRVHPRLPGLAVVPARHLVPVLDLPDRHEPVPG